MADHRGAIPKIEWGSSFANTILFPGPPESAISWPQPREGSTWAEFPSGEADSWITGTREMISFQVVHVPPNDVTKPYPATGWDAADGWRAFFLWAWKGNALRFYPDKGLSTFHDCYLIAPPPDRDWQPQREGNTGLRSFAMKLRTTDGSAIPGY